MELGKRLGGDVREGEKSLHAIPVTKRIFMENIGEKQQKYSDFILKSVGHTLLRTERGDEDRGGGNESQIQVGASGFSQ